MIEAELTTYLFDNDMPALYEVAEQMEALTYPKA
jgi:hypothetical protein